jgi:hypothetical protein
MAEGVALCYRFLFLKAAEVMVSCIYLLLAQGQEVCIRAMLSICCFLWASCSVIRCISPSQPDRWTL